MADRRLAILASHPIQYYSPLYRALAKECDLTIFYAHRASPSDQAAAGFGVAFEWDGNLLEGYRHSFLNNVSARPRLREYDGCDTPEIGARLKDGGFDALLIQGWFLKSFVQGLSAARRIGLPVMVRGDSQLATPRSRLKRVAKALAYPFFLRRYDAALYVGQRSREYWRHYHYPEERLFFAPHCVDTQWFAARATSDLRTQTRARLGVAESECLLLMAGKLIPRKRPLDVVEAIAGLRAQGKDAALLIAGLGPLREALDAHAAALGVPIRHLGFCNQSEMPAAYAASDMLVLASDDDTWGLVANEALACGRPVLLSDACGSAPDLAGDGAAGARFPMGDVEALAAAAARLIDRPPTPEGIRLKSEAYSIARAVEGILQAADFAIAARRR